MKMAHKGRKRCLPSPLRSVRRKSTLRSQKFGNTIGSAVGKLSRIAGGSLNGATLQWEFEDEQTDGLLVQSSPF